MMKMSQLNTTHALSTPFMNISALLNQLSAGNKTETSMLIEDFLSADTQADAMHELDLLQTARDLLEHGQIDKARSILESAVMHGESEINVHQDLLEIYHQSNDQQNFSKVLQHLNVKGYSIPRVWDEVAAFFDMPAHPIYA